MQHDAAIRDSFGLTAAESRLALRLLTGESLRSAAAALGITYESARSHLKSIFPQDRDPPPRRTDRAFGAHDRTSRSARRSACRAKGSRTWIPKWGVIHRSLLRNLGPAFRFPWGRSSQHGARALRFGNGQSTGHGGYHAAQLDPYGPWSQVEESARFSLGLMHLQIDP
jgi:hypothetical protein